MIIHRFKACRQVEQGTFHPIATELIVAMTIAVSTAVFATFALADTRYASRDGNLMVQYGSSCSTTSPSGSYRVQNGVTGDLVALDCSRIGGDVAEHRFTDTSGDERCYGRMTQMWGQRVVTVWEIEGAVSGYSCSQTGRRVEIEMDSGQQL